MTLGESHRTRRVLAFVAMTIAIGLIAGCDEQAGTWGALRDFVVDFARSGLAAFLL